MPNIGNKSGIISNRAFCHFKQGHLIEYCSAEAGNLNEAIELYFKHLEIRPDHPAALSNRALCYKKMGDLEAVLQVRGGGTMPGLGEEQGDRSYSPGDPPTDG